MRRPRISAPPLAAAFVALTFLSSPLLAQSTLEDALRQLNSANGKGYLQPLADLFGSNMSSGWYHTAVVGKKPFAFSLEFVGAVSAVEDKHKTYTAVTPAGFTPATFETATIFGGQGATVDDPGGTSYRGSDGILEADYMPSVVPQVRVGIGGTELIVRYFSSSLVSAIDEEDFPELNLLGIGGRHSISQHFDNFPVDLSVGVFYSSIDLGSGGDAGVSADYSGLAFGLQASKTFSVLTIFAGAASDGGTMTLGYTTTNPEETDPDVSVDLDVERKIKFTGGASLKLGPIRLFGDASFGPATTYSAGLRIGS
jgi:hypothetical protein